MKSFTNIKTVLGIGILLLMMTTSSFPLAILQNEKRVANSGEIANPETIEAVGSEKQEDIFSGEKSELLLSDKLGMPVLPLTSPQDRKTVKETLLVETTSGEIVRVETSTPEERGKVLAFSRDFLLIKKVEADMEGVLLGNTVASNSNLTLPLRPPIENVADPSNRKITVAVIDSGIDWRHPAFAKTIWANQAEKNGKEGVDDDKNGLVDDIYGWNFVDGNIQTFDTVGHGTHISGIIAAERTPLSGMEGVNTDGVQLMILKIADSKKGLKLSSVLAALEYAYEQDVDVVNMSFGFPAKSDILQNMLKKMKEKGIFLVAAGGNAADGVAQYPAAYPEVLAVGVTKLEGGKWKIVNAEDWVEVFVPGRFFSTLPYDRYGIQSGSSQAAALVTGVYSFYKSHFSERNSEEISSSIKRYSEQFREDTSTASLAEDKSAPPATEAWITEVIDILQSGRLPSWEEQRALELRNIMTVEEIRSFLLELLEPDETVARFLPAVRKSTTTLPAVTSPNTFVSSLYSASLFSEEDPKMVKSLAPTPIRALPPLRKQFMKIRDAKMLLIKLQRVFFPDQRIVRNGRTSSVSSSGVVRQRNISRQEFVEMVVEVFGELGARS